MTAYVIIFCLLTALELGYLAVGRRLGAIDVPNERSSHLRPEVLGGGVMFYFAALVWFVWSGCSDWFLMGGLTLLAAVSFIDDLHEVPVRIRLVAQFAGAWLMMWQAGLTPADFGVWVAAMVLGVGLMNAFNFMDGINGLGGLYSLVTLLWLSYINIEENFIDGRLLGVSAVGCLVFCFFNFRRRALCFAGDVGSIVIGAIVFYALARLIIHTGNLGWLVLVAVYGVDTVLTICRRLALRQNIFQAHRMHAYQLLCNELGCSHIGVAAALSVLQAIIDIPAALWGVNGCGYLVGIVGALAAVWLVIVAVASRKK